MATPKEDKIIERLDNIGKILALSLAADKSATQSVHLLRLAGFDYRTIAEVLEIKPETARVLDFQYRSKRRETTRRSK